LPPDRTVQGFSIRALFEKTDFTRPSAGYRDISRLHADPDSIPAPAILLSAGVRQHLRAPRIVRALAKENRK